MRRVTPGSRRSYGDRSKHNMKRPLPTIPVCVVHTHIYRILGRAKRANVQGTHQIPAELHRYSSCAKVTNTSGWTRCGAPLTISST